MCHEILRPVVLACLVLANSACQPQGPGIQAAMANGPAEKTPVIYFGDLFRAEEASLATMPRETAEPPTF